MPSRDSERQAFPDDSFEIFEIRGPGHLCGGDFGCETWDVSGWWEGSLSRDVVAKLPLGA